MVLVNDGSRDNSGAICDYYASEYENITVIHQENGGVSVARNTAVEYALKHGNHENDWISFVDSDDFVHPLYLEYLHRAATDAGVMLSCCGHIRSESDKIDNSKISALQYTRLTPEEYLCTKSTDASVPWGKLYQLALFTDIRYPAGKIYEDNFTTYKILFGQTQIAFTRTPLYCWYLNSESITRSKWTPAQIDMLDALSEQLAFFKENGYADAYRRILPAMLTHSIFQLRSVHVLSPQYDHLLKDMKRRRTSAVHLYAKEFGYLNTLTTWFDLRIAKPFKWILRKESISVFIKRRVKNVMRRLKFHCGR